jgi:hypothetical protein
MNLVADCLREFGDVGLADLRERVEPELPRKLLLEAADTTPWRHEARELAERMGPPAPHAPHRNPEVYGQIALLAHAFDPELTLDLLRVQLGLARAETLERLPPAPLRLVHVDGSIREGDPGGLRRIEDEVVARVEGVPFPVLMPRTGLFRDLVPSNLYLDAPPPDRGELLAKVEAAAPLIREHSEALWDDVVAAVRCLVLVPPLDDAKQWSYNLRLSYFGAIFVDAFAVGAHGVAEAIVHEYFHQRLWQWWDHEPPSGLPPEDRVVVSPVTGRPKPARVMLQALLIYAAAQRLNADLAARERGASEAESAWSERRSAELGRALPGLRDVLLDCLDEDTTAGRIVEHLGSRLPALVA